MPHVLEQMDEIDKSEYFFRVFDIKSRLDSSESTVKFDES